jgi:hypothetical protein
MRANRCIASQRDTPNNGTVLCSSILLLVILCAPTLADSIAPEVFKTMNREQTLSIVETALKERDSWLQNCRFVVTEECQNIDTSDGRKQFMWRSEYEYRRSPAGLWMHFQEVFADSPGGELYASWDGLRNRRLAKLGPSSPLQGSIDDHKSSNFLRRGLLGLLGVAQIYPQGAVSAWLVAMHNGGFVKDDGLETFGNNRILHIVIEDRPHINIKKILDVDPSKDMTPVRLQSRYEEDGHINYFSLEAQDFQQIQNHWVPRSVLWKSGTSAVPGVETQIEYQMKDFSIGTVTDQDLKVTFPVGTKVCDTINQIFYVVGAGGKVTMTPLVNGTTGKQLPPGNPALVDVASLQSGQPQPWGVFGLTSKEPLAAASGLHDISATTDTDTSSMIRMIIGGAVVVVGVIGLLAGVIVSRSRRGAAK